jgi:hypothetical protein
MERGLNLGVSVEAVGAWGAAMVASWRFLRKDTGSDVSLSVLHVSVTNLAALV